MIALLAVVLVFICELIQRIAGAAKVIIHVVSYFGSSRGFHDQPILLDIFWQLPQVSISPALELSYLMVHSPHCHCNF
jgi:hypothetical protein